MVPSWNIRQIVKKKNLVTETDINDWSTFTKKMGNIRPKDVYFENSNFNINSTKKLDLHGFSLDEANIAVEDFIADSFENGFKKLVVVTGKGSRSKSHEDPYRSKNLSMLKNSIPEYIRNNQELSNKISRISTASLKDGGEGAIYIFLKNKNKIKE